MSTKHVHPARSRALTAMALTATVSVSMLSLPAVAGARSDSLMTLAIGLHGSYRGGAAKQERNSTPFAGGVHLRLKMMRIFGLRVEAEYPHGGDDPAELLNGKAVVLVPTITLLGSLELYPNRYLAPMIIAGVGWDLSHESRPAMLIGGFGLELGLTRHWTLAAEGRLLLPPAKILTQHFSILREGADTEALLALPAEIRSFKRLVVLNYQFLLTIRYYL